MQSLWVASDPGRLRFLEALDRLTETMLLQALAGRAQRELDERRAADEQRERTQALARDLLRQDLEAAFGLTTLTLLQAMIADGRQEGDDTRALLTYRLRYELRIDRGERRWVLAVFDDAVDVLYSQKRPLLCSFSSDLHGEEATELLWCGIAELYALWTERWGVLHIPPKRCIWHHLRFSSFFHRYVIPPGLASNPRPRGGSSPSPAGRLPVRHRQAN